MAQLYAGNQNLNCRQTWRLDENNLSLKTYLNSGLNPAVVSSQSCLLHSHYVLNFSTVCQRRHQNYHITFDGYKYRYYPKDLQLFFF